MRFERITMENFKCYDDADLTLDPGVTVIHGLNGSGKSSLLEACFFALYGSKAIDEKLEDVVTIGADDCTVELWFTHAGGDYHLTRRVRNTGERATTAKCVLETPEDTFEGARSVRRRVTELLRMDSEAFVNCAYVRQGEVNKLINASASDRQDMLDDLLQLGKLEEYRERASDARVGVKRVRDDKRAQLEQLDEQIAEKEEKDLHERLNALESTLAETTSEIERLEDQRETAQSTLEEATAVLDEQRQRREELAELREDIEELEAEITETESERERLKERIAELKDEREQCRETLAETLAETELDEADAECVDARIDELDKRADGLQSRIETQKVEAQKHSGNAEALDSQAEDLRSRAVEKRREADSLETDLADTRERLDEQRSRLDEIDGEIETLETRFADASVAREDAADHLDAISDELDAARRRVTELETKRKSERESLREAEALLDAGKCPECGQNVEESPHVDSIEADRERVAERAAELETVRDRVDELEAKRERAESLADAADRLSTLEDSRENVAKLIEERESGLADDEQRIETLREDADGLDEQAAEKSDEAEAAEERAAEARSVIGECNQEKQQVKQAIGRLERVEELLDAIGDHDSDIEQLREKRSQQAEMNDQRRDHLAEKRGHSAELAEQVDEERLSEAKGEKQRAEGYIEKADGKLDELREKRDSLTGNVGAVQNEIEAVERLREQRDALAGDLSKLESLYDESEQLQEMYGTLRAELRQRNVETLERMVNETFSLVYQNDSYSHIDLDREYQLTVFQKDGEPLEPEQLSGGERALFNLSLRCAIYRLLAEGIEGAAPMPPLILDEPTVFLDSGHVTQLLDLVEYMRDEVGVDQILVVSHDEELVGAADDLVRVEKDATSNRSHVDRVDRIEEQVAELA